MKKNLQFGLGVCVVSVLALVVSANQASAQQGVFITQASTNLAKLVNKGNSDGYALQNNSFSIGGGWLKKSEKWVGIYTVQLNAGKQYRFLAAGDNDARDVDVRVTDLKGETVYVADEGTSELASVNFSPKTSGRYLVQIRLYDSRDGLDAVCLSVMMVKGK